MGVVQRCRHHSADEHALTARVRVSLLISMHRDASLSLKVLVMYPGSPSYSHQPIYCYTPLAHLLLRFGYRLRQLRRLST